MNTPFRLLRLIQLHEGLLPGDQSRALRRQLSHDRALRRQWKLVRRACRAALMGAGGDLAAPNVDAELPAAYAEGRLAESPAAQWEELCWRHPELLLETVSTVRFMHQTKAVDNTLDEEPVDSFTQRLLSLIPSAPAVPSTVDPPVRRVNGHSARVPPVQIHPQHDSVAGRLRRRSSARRLLYLWAAGVACLALLLGLTYWSWTPLPVAVPEETTADDDAKPPQLSDHRAPEIPEPVPLDPGNRTPDFDWPIPEIVHDDSDSIRDTDDFVLDPWSEDQPLEDQYQPPLPTFVPPVWERIEGLVAKRHVDSQRWVGVQFGEQAELANTFVTLPGSWAMARLNEYGQIVMDADTSITLGGHVDQPLDVVLRHGRIAFRQMPRNARVRIRLGQGEAVLRATQEGTTVGVANATAVPHIYVKDGEAEINEIPIVQGRQVLFHRQQWSSPEPIGTSLRWVDRPERVARFPEALRDQLLTSRDLQRDLLALRKDPPEALRGAITQWMLSMFPVESVYDALIDRVASHRKDASTWLVTLDARDPRSRLAWRELAARTSDPQAVRSIWQWVQVLRARRPIDRTEIGQVVHGLDHSDAAIRQLSVYVLESQFGARVPFDPHAPPLARQQAIRQWTLWIRQTLR